MPKAKKPVVTNKEAYETVDRLKESLTKLIAIEKRSMRFDGVFIVLDTLLVAVNLYVHTIANLMIGIALALLTVFLTVPSFNRNREEIHAQEWFIKNFLDEDGPEHKHFLSHIKGEECPAPRGPHREDSALEAIRSILR